MQKRLGGNSDLTVRGEEVCMYFAQRVDRLLSFNDNDYSGNEKSKQQ